MNQSPGFHSGERLGDHYSYMRAADFAGSYGQDLHQKIRDLADVLRGEYLPRVSHIELSRGLRWRWLTRLCWWLRTASRSGHDPRPRALRLADWLEDTFPATDNYGATARDDAEAMADSLCQETPGRTAVHVTKVVGWLVVEELQRLRDYYRE